MRSAIVRAEFSFLWKDDGGRSTTLRPNFLPEKGKENHHESQHQTISNPSSRSICFLLAVFVFTMSGTAFADVPSGVEDGVLTIAMECAYAPYNWTQSDDSNGAVPIANVPGSFANGYDVMIGKKICEANGWELEVIQSDWLTAPTQTLPDLRTLQEAPARHRSLPSGTTPACLRLPVQIFSPHLKRLRPC